MSGHAYVRIICPGSWRGDQNKVGMPAGGGMGAQDELAANATSLPVRSHGQVGQISAVTEVRQRPGHPCQRPGFSTACGQDQIGFTQHLVHAWDIIHGSSFSEPGTGHHLQEVVNVQFRLQGVDHIGFHGGSHGQEALLRQKFHNWETYAPLPCYSIAP